MIVIYRHPDKGRVLDDIYAIVVYSHFYAGPFLAGLLLFCIENAKYVTTIREYNPENVNNFWSKNKWKLDFRLLVKKSSDPKVVRAGQNFYKVFSVSTGLPTTGSFLSLSFSLK